MILYADNEGPDQTVWMHRLDWAFVVHICAKDPSLLLMVIYFTHSYSESTSYCSRALNTKSPTSALEFHSAQCSSSDA